MDSSGKGSGWINLNGVLVQWGTTTAQQNGTYTFKKSYTSAPVVVVNQNFESTTEKYTARARATSKTGFNWHWGTTYIAGNTTSFIAIGI